MTDTQGTEPSPAPGAEPAAASSPMDTPDAPKESMWSDMSGSTAGSAETADGAAAPAASEDLLARTRASETWIAIIVFAVILVLLLIFVLENTKKVEISYFGFTGNMPLAVAMLLSAVAGVLLTAIAGTLRILQLRRRVRKGQQR